MNTQESKLPHKPITLLILMSFFVVLTFTSSSSHAFPQPASQFEETASPGDKENIKSNQHEKIDIGIFASNEINTIDIKIRPTFSLPSEGIGIDEISYTIRWPAESTININNNPLFPFFIQPQGEPQLDGEHYYQVFTNPNILNPYGDNIAANEEVVAASFEYSGDEVEYFEIINNAWTGDNQGDFYIGLRGEDGTGEIYQPVASNTESFLNINVFLEGPYQADSGNMKASLNSENILPLAQPYYDSPWLYGGNEEVGSFDTEVVDWVLVEFIDAENAESATTTGSFLEKALLVKKDGNLINQHMETPKLIGGHTLEHDLFIIIRHRNHIDVLSNNPLSYDEDSGIYSYDFSNDIKKAYGGTMGYKMIGTDLYGMVAGDGNGENSIGVKDFNIWRQNAGLENTYNPTDYLLNGSVNVSDFNIWRPNAGMEAPF